ncbi:hypothetical protein ABZ488_04635 [Streptomyces griseus]|uniref:hypothetical protein n=1 Tax=Streptomyces griseus TaxID=1911 RepID=UPI00340F3FF2
MNWRDARSWAASWEWGDAPAWAAFVLAAIALVFSIKAQRDGRRSANAAEESVKEAKLSRIAAERSTAVAEATLADQRREADERRAAEEEASRPRVELRIEYSSGNLFHLVNDGRLRAENIRLANEEPTVGGWEEGLSLGENETFTFFISGGIAYNIPAMLRFTWDGLPEPVAVRVPGNDAQ